MFSYLRHVRGGRREKGGDGVRKDADEREVRWMMMMPRREEKEEESRTRKELTARERRRRAAGGQAGECDRRRRERRGNQRDKSHQSLRGKNRQGEG